MSTSSQVSTYSFPVNLPTIDISPYLSSSPTRSDIDACKSAIAAACRDVGFFFLIGHGVPESVTSSILSVARRFFLNTPEEEKQKIKRRDAGDGLGDGARGYQLLRENVTKGHRDWHEAIDFFRESNEEQNVGAKGKSRDGPPYEFLHGRNLWPDQPPELKEVTNAYLDQVIEVGTAVVKAMGEALELEDYERDEFVKKTRKSWWVLRMIGYPGLRTAESGGGEISCGEHTDYGCVTLLLADPTPNALHVLSKTGDWIYADPVPGAFVVNIGDMMETWTNGLWKSTVHRVIHRGDGYRVSVPFFFEPDWNAEVKPLSKCVQLTGGEAKYKRVVYGEHLTRKVTGNFY
ncbi:Clavaminate synthase-like protein [Patellaria atrata CBS 101060]|uniref:Clavaminate synthase-like protein n=1 Tax=Patellaria atrata CBS 101060 TaxID=1346257 RepID=A0A9P4S917_9PEZI|nr:Clavaminate synthase-like protein [Patellaria atrata CBS 101060]